MRINVYFHFVRAIVFEERYSDAISIYYCYCRPCSERKIENNTFVCVCVRTSDWVTQLKNKQKRRVIQLVEMDFFFFTFPCALCIMLRIDSISLALFKFRIAKFYFHETHFIVQRVALCLRLQCCSTLTGQLCECECVLSTSLHRHSTVCIRVRVLKTLPHGTG